MASDTFLADDTRFAVSLEADGLVSTVLAGDITPSAADTFVTVNLGEDHGLAVEVGWHDDILELFADEFLEFDDAAFCHIVLQAEDEVVDDAVTVLHDSGADLNVTATELDKFQCVAPSLDASYTAYIHVLFDACFVENRIAGHLIDHAQCDGFDGLAGVPADGLLATHLRTVAHGDGLDSVDGADTVCATEIAGQRRLGQALHVRRHLRNNRNLHGFVDDGSIEQDELVILSDIRTETGEFHLRAGEIEFDGITASVFRHLSEFNPLLFRLSHDRSDDALGRIIDFEAV